MIVSTQKANRCITTMSQIDEIDYVTKMGIVTSEGKDHIGLYPAKPPVTGAVEGVRPLVYILTIHEGQGELVADTNHPIARPMREPANGGAPGSPWQFVGIRHSDGSAPTLIGGLVLSLANKLLFFPGGDFKFTESDHLGRFAGKPVDHFTLDPPVGLKWTSHTTLKDGTRRERHGMKNTATQRDGEMMHWLSVLAPDLGGFLTLPRVLRVGLERASTDVLRYTQESIGANYRSRALVDAPSNDNAGSFWQIDLLVGTGVDWRGLSHHPARYDNIEDLVRYDDIGKPITAGVCFSELAPEYGVGMIVTRPTGWCREPFFVTPPDEWRHDEASN